MPSRTKQFSTITTTVTNPSTSTRRKQNGERKKDNAIRLEQNLKRFDGGKVKLIIAGVIERYALFVAVLHISVSSMKMDYCTGCCRKERNVYCDREPNSTANHEICKEERNYKGKIRFDDKQRGEEK